MTGAVAAAMSGGLQAINGPFLDWLDRAGGLQTWLRSARITRGLMKRFDRALGDERVTNFAANEIEGFLKLLVAIEIPYTAIMKSLFISLSISPQAGVLQHLVQTALTVIAATLVQAPAEKAIASDQARAKIKNPRAKAFVNFVADTGVVLLSYATTVLMTASLLEWRYAPYVFVPAVGGGLFYYFKSAKRRFREKTCDGSLHKGVTAA
jgi:hypothetical protein